MSDRVMSPRLPDLSASSEPTPLGLYIHWPFCLSKCPYCDFNSHVVTQIDEAAWQIALIAELEHMARLSETSSYGKRPLHSIFIGGGTPSLMPTPVLHAVIEKAEMIFGFVPDIEITAEANPTSVETEKLKGFYEAGVNRLSLGVQALDDKALHFLGRGHNSQEALKALEKARQLFDRLSIDLIYGRKDQTAKDWHKELSQALSFELDHLSLYQLTIEPGTQFFTRARKGEVLSLDDDEMADLYHITETQTALHHLFNYEVSNYATQKGQSRHNLIYWRSHDWLGIGPGAHGRLTKDKGRLETVTRRSPQGWLSQVSAQSHAIESQQLDTGTAVIEEIMMMGLRLAEGVPLSRLSALQDTSVGWPFDASYIEQFVEAGWLDVTKTHMKASFEGRLRLNYILQALLAS